MSAPVTDVEILADVRERLVQRAFLEIALERNLTVLMVGTMRAAVPSHWRDDAERVAQGWIDAVMEGR